MPKGDKFIALSHSIAYAWLNAGYLSQNVDMAGQIVKFVKTDPQKPAG